VTVLLTPGLGCGAFGNLQQWSSFAISKALWVASTLELPIDVRLAHYGGTVGTVFRNICLPKDPLHGCPLPPAAVECIAT
jgi:hypothetical protein